ncbi:MAG: response regulator [Thermoplasmata archaeon]|nr:MAG: response regulator [Thermoplasmata archaeon]
MDEIKILYVEDDLSSFHFIKVICHHKIDHNILFLRATNGQEAMEILKKENVSLILIDYSLPDTNGLELMDRIKKEIKEIPIVIVTGYTDKKIAIEAMRKGALDHIIKWGENLNELAKRIKCCLNLALHKNSMLKFGEIKKKRESLSIIYSLLQHAVEGIKKTKLIHKTNLNSKTIEKYLTYCINREYIRITEKDSLYITTQKGFKLLEKIEEVNTLLA